MKLIDRLTGETITKTPELIQSGRYRVLQDVILNGHTELKERDVLFSDGTANCLLDEHDSCFEKNDNLDEIAMEAILTISEILRNDNNNVSPLLPSALIDDVNKLSSLEKLLEKVINKGHFHHISYQPRIDLKYDEAVIDVSRAKRLSNGTLKHLASHSECWQQRTLTGVIPRKILARFSEDDHELYENLLYARLLDKLDVHLHKRLNRITILHNELEKSLNFQTSDKAHFQLSKEICSLWALSFTNTDTEEQIETSKALKEKIEALILTIKGLKQRGLYSLTSNQQIGITIHRTNILMHDPHYQQLPPLWGAINDETANKKPEEVFEYEHRVHDAYVQYVGLVIRHALKKYELSKQNTFKWGGEKFSLSLDQDEWYLKNSKDKLTFTPWAFASDFPTISLESNKIICCLSYNDKNVSSSIFSISPLDLYVVERIGKLIDTWVLKLLMEDYSKVLHPIPNNLLNKLTCFDEIQKADKNSIKIIKPLSKNNVDQIIKDAEANDETKQNIFKQIELVEELVKCPICQNKNSSFRTNDEGFIAECVNCKSQWSFDGKTYKQFIKNNDDSFKSTGRISLQFNY